MKISIGCDIGTAFTKAVIMHGDSLERYAVVPTNANPHKALERVLAKIRTPGEYTEMASSLTSQELLDLDKVGLTGWGSSRISLDHPKLHLLNCVAKGALWAFPACRSVLDIGAQGILLLSLSDKGRVLEYRINDKCATGSGKFLEVISGALEISVEEISEVVKSADKQLTITSQCAVFTESEVVGLLNDGETEANILAAILEGLAKSMFSLSRRIRIKDDVVISGGLIKNASFVAMLQKAMGGNLKAFGPPDFIAAVGAALTVK
jgi:predicted CoA-substrate-specific enzyme activase